MYGYIYVREGRKKIGFSLSYFGEVAEEEEEDGSYAMVNCGWDFGMSRG